MKESIPCRKSTVQEYQCTVMHKPDWAKKDIYFDACLAKELFYLWDMGIQTTGCCCGKHAGDGDGHAYIGVRDEYITNMKALGYEVQFNSCRPNDEDSFIPKSV